MKNDIQAVKKVECQQSICWFSFLKPTKKMRLDESHETLQECCERTTKSKRIINWKSGILRRKEYYEEKLKVQRSGKINQQVASLTFQNWQGKRKFK